jgi:predicted TIM-barrel fold metal-dependent hydrolase
MNKGIDFHTHPLLVREMIARHPDLKKAARETYYIGNNFQPLLSFTLELDAAFLEKAVVLPMDATTSRGETVYTNEQIAELCTLTDRLVGFASVDPHNAQAATQLRDAVEKLNLKGLKLAPPLQEFDPADTKYYPIYEAAQGLNIPVLFHAGMSWEPGSRLKYGQPMGFESVIADFPKLNVVLAHLAWPWVVDAVALALKYPNLHLDTSALYFDNPADFLAYAMKHQVPFTVFERSLRKQLLFGSNYPRVEIKNMAKVVRGLGFSEECLDLVMGGNARRLLGLEA